MNASVLSKGKFTGFLFIALTAFSAAFGGVSDVRGANPVFENNSNLGVIKGIVRDETGATIADAYVSIFRVGTSTLLKQVRSASDGSFLAKIIPGNLYDSGGCRGFQSR